MGGIYTEAALYGLVLGQYCGAIGPIVETQMFFLLAAWGPRSLPPGWPGDRDSPSSPWPDSGSTAMGAACLVCLPRFCACMCLCVCVCVCLCVYERESACFCV